MSSRGKTIARVGAFAMLALLLSACIKLDMNLAVASDNTVSGTIIFALNKQLIELSGQSADDLLGSAAPVPSDVQGIETQPYEDDNFQGQQFTFDAVPLSEFNQEGGDADQLRITREGDTFEVTGALDLSSAGATGASGVSGFPGAEEIFQSAEMKISLTFPGEVQSSNGQVDGNTVTWVPTVGERLELQATASAVDNGNGGGSGGDSSLTLILIIAGVVILAAIVIGVIIAKRKPAVATVDGAPMSPTSPMSPTTTDPMPPSAAPPAAPAPGSSPPPPPPPPPPSEPQP